MNVNKIHIGIKGFTKLRRRGLADNLHGGFGMVGNLAMTHEGYCQASAYSGNASQDNFAFHYYDRDHLGNIRQVIKATGSNMGTVVQTMDYYPFGAQFCHNSTASEVQSRKYNGKEFDNMHGLNTYDYGARSTTRYSEDGTGWTRSARNTMVSARMRIVIITQ